MTAIVNGLEKDSHGAVKVEIRDAFSPESKAEISKLGFQSHGMVIYDARGQISQKLDGHLLTEDQICKALAATMGE